MKKSVVSALLAGSLLGGGAIGTAFFGANAATAQSSSSDSSSSSSSDAPPAAPGFPGDHHGHRGGPHGANLGVAASTIGVTDDELRTALESGQSIADVATAHGVDPQTVIDAMVADAKAHLADEVSSGEITQAQADQMSADLEQRITDLVNHAGGPGPGRGAGCPNMGSDGPTGSSGSDSSSSSSAPSSQGTSLDT